MPEEEEEVAVAVCKLKGYPMSLGSS